jgi:hypothetical protein
LVQINRPGEWRILIATEFIFTGVSRPAHWFPWTSHMACADTKTFRS